MSGSETINDTQGLKVKGICPNCSGNTNHKVQFSIDKSISEDFNGIPISWQGSYQIIKCDGCEGIAFRQTNWHSEHIDDPTENIYPSPENNEKIIAPDQNKKQMNAPTEFDRSKVFIVHGRDKSEETVARFIEQLGLKAIILQEQASGGKTIIEKIEANTDVGFAIILYTPCDVGGLNETELKPRARQNVVFEHGYLIGKLGREKVRALVKGDIEKPNDISGVVYIPLDEHEGWHNKLIKELRAAGYKIDMNKLI
jgi:predicted nucleotide-binding protein